MTPFARNNHPAADPVPDPGRLIELLAAFSRQTITVVGDFIVDQYVTGEICRVSREAPVLILRHRKTELLPGGGANAVNNLADLGARVLPVGAVGDDAAGHALLDYFRKKRLDTSGILCVRGWTTTTKARYLARWTHTKRQQVLRVDREPDAPLDSRAIGKITEKARVRIRRSNAVLVSDYGIGAVTPEMVSRLPRRLAVLDSRYRLLDYRCARFTAATPNEPELEAIYRCPIGNDRKTLVRLATAALRALGLKALLVTRGKDGMVLFERGHAPYDIPIYGTDEAVDVTGAGDTVIAVFTLAMAAGATFVEATHLANYAGGIVVMKRATATLGLSELEAAVRLGLVPANEHS